MYMIYDTKVSIKVIKIICRVVVLQQNLHSINIIFRIASFFKTVEIQ